MRRYAFIILLVIFVAFIGTILVFPRANIAFTINGTAVFNTNDSKICTPLSDNDTATIAHILNGKWLLGGSPSCGFLDNVSVRINGDQLFCFACDGCPIIFWKNQGRYLYLSVDEMTTLHNILAKYGFIFPCI